MWPIKKYIQRQQATIAAQIYNWPIYKLCTRKGKIPRSNRFRMVVVSILGMVVIVT